MVKAIMNEFEQSINRRAGQRNSLDEHFILSEEFYDSLENYQELDYYLNWAAEHEQSQNQGSETTSVRRCCQTCRHYWQCHTNIWFSKMAKFFCAMHPYGFSGDAQTAHSCPDWECIDYEWGLKVLEAEVPLLPFVSGKKWKILSVASTGQCSLFLEALVQVEDELHVWSIRGLPNRPHLSYCRSARQNLGESEPFVLWRSQSNKFSLSD
jgi:hypothetical protein